MIFMLVLWPTALFFFYLAWKATDIYLVKYRHALHAAAIALLLVPIGVGDLAFPACVGLLIYCWSGVRQDMMWAVVGSLKIMSVAGIVSWVALKIHARMNDFAEEHADENPHAGKKQKHSRRA